MCNSCGISFEKTLSFRISSFLTCEMGRQYNKTTTDKNVQEMGIL